MMSLKSKVTGLLAFALAIGGIVAFADVATPARPGHHSETMQECAQACSDCQRQCDLCASHCGFLLAGGKHEHLTTLMSCQDCATVCTAAAQVVSRGGPFSKVICDACAEACARCGKECEKFAGDAKMQKCAEECTKCEKACREMSKEMVLK